MSTDHEKMLAISMRMQSISRALEIYLESVAGQHVEFVLVAGVGKTAQYVSNMVRENGMELLESVLDAWRDNTLIIATQGHIAEDGEAQARS
jgi:hypothetical protein